ncbi:large ribosomal subunit protein eL6-like [Bidens hawaiensis]|uniref:large ribosomal subunit protein eL6-like n=1 Tax=Bidens hawaiensis TaxID=980011 RepID=UPI00404AD853
MAPKGRKPHVSRNPDLIRGVGKYSRSKMYHKRGLWAIKAKNGGAFPKHEKQAVAAAPVEKPPKFYPADDVKKPLVNKRKARPTKLRASITPGTVLIILAGRFKGKRVVFLKQLTSGLLLVTGPFKINGVPLRRVNQLYVIATSTKADISGVNVEKFDDKYFGKKVEKKKKKGEGEFGKDVDLGSSFCDICPDPTRPSFAHSELLDDVCSASWLDAMKSSSPRNNIIKNNYCPMKDTALSHADTIPTTNTSSIRLQHFNYYLGNLMPCD